MTATPSFCSKRAADMWREVQAVLSKPLNQWEIGEGTEVLLNTLKLERALGGYSLPNEEILEFCLEDAILETEFEQTLNIFEDKINEGATTLELMVYFGWCDELVLIARAHADRFGGTDLCFYVEERILKIIENAPLASLKRLAPKVANWAVYNRVPMGGALYELALNLIIGAL